MEVEIPIFSFFCNSALKSILAKFEGDMRDFLFEDKGCTFIACFGIKQITEVDALRAVLFAIEATAACESLGDPCKIGISMGQCFTGVCGHPSRHDFVVMGAETNTGILVVYTYMYMYVSCY